LEGSARDLTEVLFQHSPGGTEVNHAELIDFIEAGMAELCRKLNVEVSHSSKEVRIRSI
jgi:hypothetical protein